MTTGRVVQAAGAWYQVQGKDGLCYACQLRGKLRLHSSRLTSPVVVGDEVAFEPVKAQETGVIYKIMPRRNYLIRQAPHRKFYGQLLAANIDQALLVVTAATAYTQLGFIDNFLVVAEAFEIPPVIVFNKIDLLDTVQQEVLENLTILYTKLGYRTLAVSAHTQQHLPAFCQALLGKVSLLSGHSGVGKSTLVNTISPAAQQAVAPLSPFSQRGRHTTTATALLEVLPSTFLIDTPGIQTLIPYAIKNKALRHCFPELRSRATACKFYNCTHRHEPDCAVLQALARGDIAVSRYESYQQLADESHGCDHHGV
jgi:ribosome biogenesis GTPase / thiamine phosphate phosphatase